MPFTKHIAFLFVLASLSISNTVAQTSASTGAGKSKAVRALLVVAHPDDEYEMAGTIYRITQELSGTVDQLIVTNGEAVYRYSSLAERYYRVELTNEAVGRTRLPSIRREEARRAGRILGIRHQWFLNEKTTTSHSMPRKCYMKAGTKFGSANVWTSID